MEEFIKALNEVGKLIQTPALAIAIIMVIVGAIMIMVAGSDSKGKTIIISAVVGLAIVKLAFYLVQSIDKAVGF